MRSYSDSSTRAHSTAPGGPPTSPRKAWPVVTAAQPALTYVDFPQPSGDAIIVTRPAHAVRAMTAAGGLSASGSRRKSASDRETDVAASVEAVSMMGAAVRARAPPNAPTIVLAKHVRASRVR